MDIPHLAILPLVSSPPILRLFDEAGAHLAPGEPVLVVEDVITTGGSTREVVTAVQSLGARVPAPRSIIGRSSGTADVGVPRVAFLSFVSSNNNGQKARNLLAENLALAN